MALNDDERERLKAELAEIENDIARVINNNDPRDLEAKTDDLPAVQAAQHNYDQELNQIHTRSSAIIDNLARLYLGDDDGLINHEYISRKREKDADYFAKLDFLVNASQRTLINIMREIDMGAASPRMFEVLSMLQKEMRENIKLSSTNLKNIETFYKDMREDLGIQQQVPAAVQAVQEQQQQVQEEGRIITHADLNKQVDEWLKNRDKKEES